MEHRKRLIKAMAPRIRELLADGYCGDVCLCDPCACAEGAAERALDAITTGPVFEAMVANAVEGIWPGSGTVFQATGGPDYWDRLIADALRAALGATATTSAGP